MIRRPPSSTRTDTLFPYTTLFRSAVRISDVREDEGELSETAVQAQAAAKPNRSCTRVDLTSASGAANANGNVGDTLPAGPPAQRSEERRVGEECVRTGRYRWSPDH